MGTKTSKLSKSEPDQPHSILIEKGKAKNIDDCWEEAMSDIHFGDCFITGANLLDKEGNAALMAGTLFGGRIGPWIQSAWIEGVHSIVAVGLEKLVPEAKQIKFDKTSEGLQALRDDRGVAFAQDDILLFKLVQDNPSWTVVGRVFNPTDWGVGFRKGEDDIRKYVDQALLTMYHSGFLKNRLKKWWSGQELDQYLLRIDDMFKAHQ
jgi:hypothetical protein